MLNLSVRFEPRDLWVGVYWDAGYHLIGDAGLSSAEAVREARSRWPLYPAERVVRVYVCLVPCLPVRVEYRRAVPAQPAARKAA